MLCWRWMVKKCISLERNHWTMGTETWTLWWCLDVLDWWWTWLFWISPSECRTYFSWSENFIIFWILTHSTRDPVNILFFKTKKTLGYSTVWKISATKGNRRKISSNKYKIRKQGENKKNWKMNDSKNP